MTRMRVVWALVAVVFVGCEGVGRIPFEWSGTADDALAGRGKEPGGPVAGELDSGEERRDEDTWVSIYPECNPECGGRECGGDGCGGVCGTCLSGEDCVGGTCELHEDPPPEGGEFGYPCEEHADCLSGWCIETDAWGTVCTTPCIAECPPGWECKQPPWAGPDIIFLCLPICEPSCFGKDCGSDGCGGSCGQCPAGWTCNGAQQCKEPPPPPSGDCTGKECGPDGAGGLCGVCPEGLFCDAIGQCVAGCKLGGKVSYLAIGEGGFWGEALDVDEDPDTCAPEFACEDGLNNQLSFLYDQLVQFVDINVELENALVEGELVLLLEAGGPVGAGQFDLHMYAGEVLDPACDYQQALCEYGIAKPVQQTLFPNATIVGETLQAGGLGYDALVPCMVVPFLCISPFTGAPGTENTLVKAYNVRLEATVTVTDCEHMDKAAGIIGGGIDKEEAIAQALSLDPENLPVSPDMIANLLDMFLVPDMDGDGDGVPDLVSFGLKFKAIPATITEE